MKAVMLRNLFSGKFVFSLFIIASFFAGCQSEDPEPVEKLQYYDSGEVSRRHFEVEGKIEGVMTDYFPGGKVRGERTFKNGIQTGRSVFYYPGGEIREVQYYDEQGLKDGGDTTFYENGRLQLLMAFQKGLKNGYIRKWSPEGELTYEARFENDTLVEVKGKLLSREDQPGDTTGVQ